MIKQNKKLKGFTLIELIIVMAILVVLMSSILNMFRPIREVFVDSTYYEAQRTSQNGIVQYITESVRYADRVFIDNETTGSDEEAKIVDIVDKLMRDRTDVLEDYTYNVEVIAIDSKTEYIITGGVYKGRVLRYKVKAKVDLIDPTDKTKNKYTITTSPERLVLGSAYYGPHTYSIALKTPDDDKLLEEGFLNVKATSIIRDGTTPRESGINTDDIESKATSGFRLVFTDGNVVFRNIIDSTKTGVYDISKYTGTSTTDGSITYIVFTLPDSPVTPP